MPLITEHAGLQDYWIIPVIMDKNSTLIPFELTLNAIDFEGDDLIWTVSTQPSHGIASAVQTGNSSAISYVPEPNYVGSDAFIVRVRDGNGGSDYIIVDVNIQPLPEFIYGDSFES